VLDALAHVQSGSALHAAALGPLRSAQLRMHTTFTRSGVQPGTSVHVAAVWRAQPASQAAAAVQMQSRSARHVACVLYESSQRVEHAPRRATHWHCGSAAHTARLSIILFSQRSAQTLVWTFQKQRALELQSVTVVAAVAHALGGAVVVGATPHCEVAVFHAQEGFVWHSSEDRSTSHRTMQLPAGIAQRPSLRQIERTVDVHTAAWQDVVVEFQKQIESLLQPALPPARRLHTRTQALRASFCAHCGTVGHAMNDVRGQPDPQLEVAAFHMQSASAMQSACALNWMSHRVTQRVPSATH